RLRFAILLLPLTLPQPTRLPFNPLPFAFLLFRLQLLPRQIPSFIDMILRRVRQFCYSETCRVRGFAVRVLKVGVALILHLSVCIDRRSNGRWSICVQSKSRRRHSLG